MSDCRLDIEKKLDRLPSDFSMNSEDIPITTSGQICFKGFGQEASDSAPYLIVKCPRESKDLTRDMTSAKYVRKYIKDKWGLQEPKLIVSVTGGADKFHMKPRHLAAIKQGLMKAATSADAWIITGGTKSGVMELVGQAAKDYMLQNGSYQQNLVVIGIPSLNVVSNGDIFKTFDQSNFLSQSPESCNYDMNTALSMKSGKRKKAAILDPHHTHFLLVDDGRDGEDITFGGEIGFRAAFEQCNDTENHSEEQNVPVVLLVLEGGMNTLKTAREAIVNNTPVIVIAGSGRAADFIDFASKKCDGLKSPETQAMLMDEAVRLFPLAPDDAKADAKYRDCIDTAEKLLEEDRKHLLTIFHLDEDGVVRDIDQAILIALLRARTKGKEAKHMDKQTWTRCIDLSLTWNRCDVAQQELFNDENRSQWKEFSLDDSMMKALLQDKEEFVLLFMENGVDLKKFLSYDRLQQLYTQVLDIGKDDTNVDILNNLINEAQKTFSASCCGSDNKEEKTGSGPTLRIIGKVLNDLTQYQRVHLYQNAYTDEEKKYERTGVDETRHFEHPERELFLWALAFNRKELAKIFWKAGTDHIGASLTANMLLKSLADMADREEEFQLAKELLDTANEFEEMATGVLEECYKKSKKMSHDLLVRSQTLWGRNTLFSLSNASEQMFFMQHDCCQTKLNKLWKGKMAIYTSMWKIIISLFIPFAIWFIDFDKDEEEDIQIPLNTKVIPLDSFGRPMTAEDRRSLVSDKRGSRAWIRNRWCCYGSRFMTIMKTLYYFHTAPVVKFFYHTISYVIFLCLFSFFLMTDLEPYEAGTIEYVVWAWAVTMWIDETRQLCTTDGAGFYQKTMNYFSDIWNQFDQISYYCMVLAVILRYTLDDDMFVWARMMYSITIILFFMRVLQAFYVEITMGPKVVMIKRMMRDLVLFLMIFAVFLFCYGVVAQVLMYPNAVPSWKILQAVVYEPFFALFGQFNLQELLGSIDGCTSNETIYTTDPTAVRCPQQSWLVLVLFSIYVILTYIMLLNLLIAIFSFTFQNVQDKAETTWRFYRYGLINEYFERPTLAPPLIIISIVWRFGLYLYHGKNWKVQHDFKKELDENENKRLTAFEHNGTDNYFATRRINEEDGSQYKISLIEERVEKLQIDAEGLKDLILKKSDNDRSATIQRHHRKRSESKKIEFEKLNNRLTGMEGQLQQVLTLMNDLIRKKSRGSIGSFPRENSTDAEAVIQIRETNFGELSLDC